MQELARLRVLIQSVAVSAICAQLKASVLAPQAEADTCPGVLQGSRLTPSTPELQQKPKLVAGFATWLHLERGWQFI